MDRVIESLLGKIEEIKGIPPENDSVKDLINRIQGKQNGFEISFVRFSFT